MRLLIAIILITTQFLIADSACADYRLYSRPYREPLYSANKGTISVNEAKKMAEERYGGKELSAKYEEGGSGGVSRVK